MKNYKNFRLINLCGNDDGGGVSLFVFPAGADHGNIFETLDAHGFDPDGRHNTSMYDCSGMLCSSRIHIMDGRKATVASQHFYRDI